MKNGIQELRQARERRPTWKPMFRFQRVYYSGNALAMPNRLPLPLSGHSWRCDIDGTLSVSLTAYHGCESQAPHHHNRAQLTIQLAGALEERIGRREYLAHGTMIGYKPAGAIHADRWGAAGALLFTINARDEDAHALFGAREAGWRKARGAAELTELIAALPHASVDKISEILPDIVALSGAGEVSNPPSGNAPPTWLLRIFEALCDDPVGNSISALSQAEGVHRIHLARSFRRHFGVTPSKFRRGQMAARLAAILPRQDLSIADCSLETGFCDQSHATRILRNETGFSPAHLRSLICSH